MTMTSWLGAQGIGGAGTGFAEMATALRRRCELDGAIAAATGKAKQGNGDERRRPRLNSVAQKRKEATQEPSPCQHDAEDGHDRDWKPKEGHQR